MTDAEALEAIRLAWTAWAGHEIEAPEAMARIAEALEGSGRGVVVGDWPANEG